MIYIGGLTYDVEIVYTNAPIIIYGAGYNGNEILKYLKRNKLEQKVIGFIDEKKKDTSFEEYDVYSLNYACKMYPEAHYIISGKYIKEMFQNLLEKGIKNIHIDFLA